MDIIDPEDPDSKMPLNKLAAFTTDGASDMISPKDGILGNLMRAVNYKLFSLSCPLHRLVSFSKKKNPKKKTLSDTLFSWIVL